jgi:hypothetical protein
MAIRAPTPMTARLREAFHRAVELYPDWSAAFAEREVSIEGKPHSISAVCRLVAGFSDQLPDNVFDELRFLMRAHHVEIKENLAKDRSYAIGAKYLLKLIDAKKSAYRRLKQSRRPPPVRNE